MKKYILRILFAALMASIVILPLLPKPKTEEEYTYAVEMASQISFADEPIIYLYNADGISAELPADGWDGYYIDFSLRRDHALAIPDTDFDNGGTLYHVGSGEATLIANGVYHTLVSDSGRGIYVTDRNKELGTGKLHYFNGEESICIEPQLYATVHSTQGPGLAISPDGKTVGYCRANSDGSITGMLYRNGKYTELGENIFPIAVADDVNYLYYRRPVWEGDTLVNASYYVRSDGGDIFLGESRYAYFMFNYDLSEAIVTSLDFDLICVDGGEELRPLGDFYPVGVISPQSGLSAELDIGASPLLLTEYTRIGIDSFRDKILHGHRTDIGNLEHDICLGASCPYHNTAYLDEELQLHVLTESTYNMQRAAEGYAALYKQDKELYLIPDVRSYTAGSEILISKYGSYFTGNADFSTVYYVNTAKTLYAYSGGSRSMIAQDVTLLTPAASNSSGLYSPGVPSAYLNGSIYFRKNADKTLWHINSSGKIEALEFAPEGASPIYLDDELLFRVTASDKTADFYRFNGSSLIKAISGIKPYRWPN